LTKGHIWPDWLKNYLPNNSTAHDVVVGKVHTFQPDPKIIIPAVSRTVRQGRAGSTKPRNTCVKCNGGWMSRIEASALEPTVRLIYGERFDLDMQSQRKVASLICLTTIRAEFANQNTIAIPQSDREWIRTNGEPPPMWRIWIAKYSGNNPGDHWCRHIGIRLTSSPQDVAGAQKCNTQTTTLVWGRLCAHAYSSTYLPDFLGYDFPLAKIWPLSGYRP
jgi:hypothetical protein